MTPAEIEALLQEAFEACYVAGRPLDTQQREILFRMLMNRLTMNFSSLASPKAADATNASAPLVNRCNPLDALTLEQRQALLQFIQEQQQQNRSWKAQLLNDWLYDRQPTTIEFVRQQYGLTWLEQIQPQDIAEYADDAATGLKVGDRIEISNGLWEWVQDEGPCQREWFPCTVVHLAEVTDAALSSSTGYEQQTNCTIRFDNGMEYEIQGVYEWNRYNWRWART